MPNMRLCPARAISFSALVAVTVPAVSGLHVLLKINPFPECSRRQIFFKPFSVLPALILQQAVALDLSEYKDGPRGLKYQVTKDGVSDGQKPQRAQKVKASYTLYLDGFKEDGGKQIDSSKGLLGERPFEFYAGVSQVIPGWDLALMDMKEGEARRLVVPASLGYGEKGAGGKIPGGATLYFEVELVEIGQMAKLGPEQEKWLAEHPL